MMAKEEKKVEDLTYEEAQAELEKIVADLEAEVHNLDAALALFERGQALAKHCAELLDQAELKVQQLTADGDLKDLENAD
jgi:exodeoxyribonuclease VII small subunit